MNAQLRPCAPILCAPLLRQVDGKLLDVLRSLAAGDWEAPTIVSRWRVRDVVAHLLDTSLRKLSMVRDSSRLEGVSIRTPQDVVQLVDRLNREGVAVYRRLSPALLISLMEVACEQSACFHELLDPFAPAAFPVSWAGEESSPNWFDTARELTERWHHQQQIRLATNRPGIMTHDLYYPVLDCFLRALPWLYRDVEAPSGAVLEVEICGDCGGRWFLVKSLERWELMELPPEAPPDSSVAFAARVGIPQELAWRLFTKGIDRSTARAEIALQGDGRLGERVLCLTAIVG